MTLAQLEVRVLAMETEIQQLKAGTQPNKADPKWVLAHAGRFKNDPGFDEIVQLGREYREALKPGRKKKPTVARFTCTQGFRPVLQKPTPPG